MVQLNFDATTIDPATGSAGQLPISGKDGLLVRITESEMRATKARDGEMLVLGLEVIQGEFMGASGEYRLNIMNKNPQAQQIAQSQLSAICHVTGVYRVQDSSQLHNIPFRVLVRNQKQSAEDAAAGKTPYTEVYGVLDAQGNQPGKAGTPPQPAQTAPQMPTQPQAAPAQAQAAPAAPGPAWGTPAAQPSAQPAPAAGAAPPWAS